MGYLSDALSRIAARKAAEAARAEALFPSAEADESDETILALLAEGRKRLLADQAADLEKFDRIRDQMQVRHAAVQTRAIEAHAQEDASSRAAALAAPLTESKAASFLISLFPAWANHKKQDNLQNKAEDLRLKHAREMSDILQDQAREIEQLDRRQTLTVFQQEGALAHFDKTTVQEWRENNAHNKRAAYDDGLELELTQTRYSSRSRERDGLGLEL